MVKGLPGLQPRHLGLKALALTLSILLWYLVNDMRLESKRIQDVKLEFQMENLPSNMFHEMPGVKTGTFTIRGQAEEISSLGPGNFIFHIPLQSVNVGDNTIILNREMIQTVNVQERVKERIVVLPWTIVPDRVSIQVAYRTKQVPVKVLTSGEPASGYIIADKRVTPSTVAVTGSEEVLNQVSEVDTVNLDVTNIDANVKVDVMLDFANLPVHPVVESAKQVQVEFVVEKKPLAQ